MSVLRSRARDQNDTEVDPADLSVMAAAAKDTASDTACRAVHRLSRLCHWDDLPDWQRDNHYIHTGYVRETGSARDTLASLFYIHNESVNIWTHLFPSILVLVCSFVALDWLRPHYPTTSLADHLVLAVFALGCVACLGMSGTYHCMKSHSPRVAVFGNKLDYLGIVLLIACSMISLIYYGMAGFPRLRACCWGLTSVLGALCACVCLMSQFRAPDWRPYRAAMFVAYGLSGLVPLVLRTCLDGFAATSHRIQLPWLLLEALAYIGGALIYALRLPERLMPGRFDIWGHSHQIFHVCVLLGAFCHARAVLGAYHVYHSGF